MKRADQKQHRAAGISPPRGDVFSCSRSQAWPGRVADGVHPIGRSSTVSRLSRRGTPRERPNLLALMLGSFEQVSSESLKKATRVPGGVGELVPDFRQRAHAAGCRRRSFGAAPGPAG